MSTEPFTDEILSTIIDGEANDDIVAAVAGDPAAAARLTQLRKAVAHVATPVPDATPERRSASIAAAMAAATTAPEVTSLAAARHERAVQQPKASTQRGRWLAAVAAAIAFVVAVPIIASLGGSDDSSADTASTSFDVVVDVVDDSDDGTDDTAEGDGAADVDNAVGVTSASSNGVDLDDSDADSPDDAMDDAGMSNDSTEEATPVEGEAVDEPATTEAPADADSPAIETAAAFLAAATPVNSIEVLNSLIDVSGITPTLNGDQARGAIIEAGLSPACIDSLELNDAPSLALAVLDEDGSEERLLLLSFDEDGNVTTLDAEDCALLG